MDSNSSRPSGFPAASMMAYLLVRGVTGLINGFPIQLSHWLARRIGDFLFLVMRKRRKIALSNLDIAFKASIPPSRKLEIAKEAFRNLTVSLLEFFRIPQFLKESQKHFRFTGTEHLDRAFARGKGVVLVISHLGSWEYLAFLPYLRGYPCSVIGRAVKNPYIYKWVESLRRKTTLNHIDKNQAIKPMLSELKKNHLVAILIDQWAGSGGLWLDFFQEGTSTTSIPARLAKKTGCALVPAYCLRLESGNYEIQIKAEVPIEGGEDWEEKTTQKLNHLLEEQILAYPEQWIWTHKRWKGIGRCPELKTKLPARLG